MNYPLKPFSPIVYTRESHPQFQKNPPYAAKSQAGYRFGYAPAGAMGLIRNTMSAIEADKILELTISDVGAMVLPRTAIEAVKRGPLPAQETLFREISGTLTNTYLAGWLGALAVVFFNAYKANPKGMDFKAWIDAKTLDTFGGITREVLRDGSIKTPKQLQEAFLRTTLGRLKTTSVIPSLPEYKGYFPAGGQLQDVPEAGFKPLSRAVDMFLGRDGGKIQPHLHRAFNVEEQVRQMQGQKQYVDEIEIALEKFREKFSAARGNIPLTSRQKSLLAQLESEERSKLLKSQRRSLRMLKTQSIRRAEGNFLNRVAHFVTTKGQLSEDVFMLDAKGNPINGMGARNVKDLLKKTKYYMEEYLNRALANPSTGEITSETLTRESRKAIASRLFAKGGRNWVQRNIFPNLQDGLLSYTYKSKYFMVLLPVAVTLMVGCSMVFVNNWITRNKMGGKDVFPGEEALKSKMGGGH